VIGRWAAEFLSIMPTASWGHPCRCCLCPAPPGNCRGAPKGAAGTVTRAACSPAGLAGT